MTRKFEGKELVFASHNKGKIKEIKELLSENGFNIEVKSAAEFEGLESPEETEDNFLGNALIKAKYVAEKTGKVALADDSGFCVDALDGAPGVYSADWTETENGRDFMLGMNKVNNLMQGSTNKKSHFVTCLVLCWPDGHYEHVEGYVHGDVVWPPRGESGFGYDPIFQPEGYNITFGEMADADKNKLSHRANALKLMLDKCF